MSMHMLSFRSACMRVMMGWTTVMGVSPLILENMPIVFTAAAMKGKSPPHHFFDFDAREL